MKVTPVKRKFGKYSPGDEFELPDKTAKIFISINRLAKVEQLEYQTADLGYQTRMMSPWGLKKDGTPRARPGRKVIE